MKRPAGLVLLFLALLLPLQGFAIAAACDTGATPAVASHCAGPADGAPARSTHHDCGTCCLALTTAPTALPVGRALSVAQLPAVPPASHPTLLLDRLDRPPRG